jgi:hypothetical protein
MSEEGPRKRIPCNKEDDSDSDSSREEARRKRKKKEKKKKRRKEERREKRRSYSSEDESDGSRRRRTKKRRKEKKKLKGPKEGNVSYPDEFAEQDASVMEAKPWPKADLVSEPVRVDPAESQKEQVERQAKLQRMVPMSREQYEAQQSQVREVYDPESGRYRLVRGTGEIIERIVSRADHAAINQRATQGDGSSFTRSIYQAAKR